jgi:hypothetical protein
MEFDASNLSEQPLFYVTQNQRQASQESDHRILLSTNEADERLKACGSCDHYRKRLRQCSLCNCIMPVKVRFQKASCPDGRW